MPSPAASVAMHTCAPVLNLLSSLAFMGIHAAVDFAGAETPSFKMIAHVAKGYPCAP